MKNCNVSHSKKSGLYVGNGGLMTIDGKDTTIHHNCTDGNSYHYGLDAGSNSSSSIQITMASCNVRNLFILHTRFRIARRHKQTPLGLASAKARGKVTQILRQQVHELTAVPKIPTCPRLIRSTSTSIFVSFIPPESVGGACPLTIMAAMSMVVNIH